jgi:hypothetical protein
MAEGQPQADAQGIVQFDKLGQNVEEPDVGDDRGEGQTREQFQQPAGGQSQVVAHHDLVAADDQDERQSAIDDTGGSGAGVFDREQLIREGSRGDVDEAEGRGPVDELRLHKVDQAPDNRDKQGERRH